jgi:hypothetical protein
MVVTYESPESFFQNPKQSLFLCQFKANFLPRTRHGINRDDGAFAVLVDIEAPSDRPSPEQSMAHKD